MRARLKENRRSPTRIALTTLVATIPTARRTIANRIVLRIPSRTTSRIEHWFIQPAALFCIEEDRSRTASRPTAMPNRTQRNTGVTVMTAVICRKAVTIPMIKLTINAAMTQLHV